MVSVQQPQVTRLSLGLFGGEKTAKTTFALSLPKPMVIFDFDRGIHRALPRYLQENPQLTWAEAEIPKLPPIDPDILVWSVNQPPDIPGLQLEGHKSFWESLMPVMVSCIQHLNTKSVVIDTGGHMWDSACAAQFEKANENAKRNGKPPRERLSQIEYATPNAQMRGLVNLARSTDTHLCITHHATAKWDRAGVSATPIGETWDGWSHLGRHMDVIASMKLVKFCTQCAASFVPTPINNKNHERHQGAVKHEFYPELAFEECGYSLNLKEVKLGNPDYDKVVQMVDIFAKAPR